MKDQGKSRESVIFLTNPKFQRAQNAKTKNMPKIFERMCIPFLANARIPAIKIEVQNHMQVLNQLYVEYVSQKRFLSQPPSGLNGMKNLDISTPTHFTTE